ncbi:MAG: arginine--tRNA ligase [Pseudomonadota bacterium]
MDIFASLQTKLAGDVLALAKSGALPAAVTEKTDTLIVEPPRDPSHGDAATPAALMLAKLAKSKPRDIADIIAEKMAAWPEVASVDIAGPGFINLRLEADYVVQLIPSVLAQGLSYGQAAEPGDSSPINVEYVSANPTGPLHMGHCRGAVFGDALASLLEFAGHQVTREYYINDAGSQIDTLARSTHLRYREALGEEIGEIPEGLYPGDYLIPVGQSLAEKHGDQFRDQPEAEWLDFFKRKASGAMMQMVRDDLAQLGIEQECFFSERTLHENGGIDAALEALSDKGHLYEGVLEPPKGKKPEDWEPRPQTLFRATDFGDDVDRPLKKSDGSYTYFAADIAYHLNKFERGYRDMIDVWGADHSGYIKRMQAATKAISGGEADLDVKVCQMVRLFRAGEPVKMSKRSGSFVTLAEVVEEVGKDVVRFMMLTRKNDAQLDFDFAKVTEQSKDNPVFYVQYAHARICSAKRRAEEAVGSFELGEADLSLLNDPNELELLMLLAEWPRQVRAAASAHEPHRIAFYLQTLAAQLHSHWNRGNDNPSLRFILDENKSLTIARIALLETVRLVLAAGLTVLGVTPVEEMR